MRSGLSVFLAVTVVCLCGCVSRPSPPKTVNIDPFLLKLPEPLNVELPCFKTEQELREWTGQENTGQKVFEIELSGHRNLIVSKPWGSGIVYEVLYFYNFDLNRKFWVPRAFWITRTKAVSINVKNRSGEIVVRSRKGKVILSTNLDALEARVWTDE